MQKKLLAALATLLTSGIIYVGSITGGFVCAPGEYAIDVEDFDERYCMPSAEADIQISNLKTALTNDSYDDSLSVPVRLASLYSGLRDQQLIDLMESHFLDENLQPILDELHIALSENYVDYYNTLKDRVLVTDTEMNEYFLLNFVVQTEYANGANPLTILP